MLIFDTYEKVSSNIDDWLWQYLIGDNSFRQSSVKIIIAGRKNILKIETWRKLQQDRNVIYDVDLNRFDEEQTQQYLKEIGIEDSEKVAQIFKITKGLPYYLNGNP